MRVPGDCDFARPRVLDALLAVKLQRLTKKGEIVVRAELALAERNLLDLEYLWPVFEASLTQLGVVVHHYEPLEHEVLLLLLSVPIPELDLLVCRGGPPEQIPLRNEGRHSKDHFLVGLIVDGDCGKLITGG
jgi:hypothetical protein